MKRTMSAPEFSRLSHELELRQFLYDTCNQPETDCSFSQSVVFDSVRVDGTVGLLSFHSDRSHMRIQNVQSVTVDTESSALGAVVAIHSRSPIGGTDRRFVLLAK